MLYKRDFYTLICRKVPIVGYPLPHLPPAMGVRDQFRLGGLRSVARICSPLLARKSSGFARILHDFFFCPNMAIWKIRICPPARSLRSLAEDLKQMCPLRGFAPPKLKVFRRACGWLAATNRQRLKQTVCGKTCRHFVGSGSNAPSSSEMETDAMWKIEGEKLLSKFPKWRSKRKMKKDHWLLWFVPYIIICIYFIFWFSCLFVLIKHNFMHTCYSHCLCECHCLCFST